MTTFIFRVFDISESVIMLTIDNKIQYHNRIQVFKRLPIKNMNDIFAKSRNGHLLKDTYDKEYNSLHIFSNGLYPANVLSNLARKEFVYDGVHCASIEGFLQSLKIKDPDKQTEICAMMGGSAKKISKKGSDWLNTQTLYWKGREYKRDSKEYEELVLKAFLECYKQNEVFKTALDSTKGMKLTHKHGSNDKTKTILTADEFIKILTTIRDDKPEQN